MKTTIVCKGRIIDLKSPRVMGILNITPDSFYDGGALTNEKLLLQKAEEHLREGATFLDIGASSTRPGAEQPDEEEEMRRLMPAVNLICSHFPEAIVSVDTYRSRCAAEAVAIGATMINDVSGGKFDSNMLHVVNQLAVPYIGMHLNGSNANAIHDKTDVQDVVKEVHHSLLHLSNTLCAMGHSDLILDPGFGFGKSLADNYELLNELPQIASIGHPVLVGVSRKSMIHRVLNITAIEALNGTTALHTLALIKGASILRVHDVKEAMQCIVLMAQWPAPETRFWRSQV